jgi:hypothetical protein
VILRSGLAGAVDSTANVFCTEPALVDRLVGVIAKKNYTNLYEFQ